MADATVSSEVSPGGVFNSSDVTYATLEVAEDNSSIENPVTVEHFPTKGGVFKTSQSSFLSQDVEDSLLGLKSLKDAAIEASENAATSEANASESETNAETSATNAATSASNASISETNASVSATNASTSATNAATSETNAATSETNASTSETNAANSATSAATSATNASTSETNAATSESNAATSESNASTSETNAANSATSASSSATASANSATAASTSETNAATSASSASTSATNAATSETNAATSATNAATSATSASNAQTAAETAETNAETAQSAAELARDEAVAAQEAIDGLYLGAQSSDPTVDLNGNPVTVGDWYFNTTVNQTKIYDGSNWDTIDPTLLSDTTPQLGGDLDLNSSSIIGTGNINITGNVSLTGTVDGRDVGTDGTKLDNIEANADVTDAANVTAAGALMDSEVTNLAQVKAFNSADYATAAQGILADSALQSGDNVSSLINDAGYSTTTGTVTSVAATVPTGLTVTGSPITSTGTLAVTYDVGYAIPTTTKQTQWDTAYGWGDHSTVGYLTSFTETNDLSTNVTWANVPDANITQSSVTQHQAALSITESQISDLTHYTDTNANTAIDARVTQTFVNNLNVDADTLDGLNSTDFDPAGTAVALAIALG